MGLGLVNVDLGEVVNGAASLINAIGNQIRGKVPVDVMKLAELEVKMAEIQNVVPTLLSEVDKAQSVVNAEDAKSTSFWQSGWRPAAAWVCVTALFYEYLALPFVAFGIGLFRDVLPPMPKLDMGELLTLLFGLLGLGTLRTVDKFKKK